MKEGLHNDLRKNDPLVTADKCWRLSISGDNQSLDDSLGTGNNLKFPASSGQLVYISSHDFTSQKNVENNSGELHRV